MEELVKKFLPYAIRELDLDSLPDIELVDDSSMESTFGQYGQGKIRVCIKDRHPNDVLRTLAHELVHWNQDCCGILHSESGATGGDEENEANSVAGIIMRNFNQANPEVISGKEQLFEESVIDYGIREYLEQRGYKFLGNGVDQEAYLEPDTGLVLKIFGTGKNLDTKFADPMPAFSKDQQMFFMWANFCMENSDNEFLPKFYGFESFEWTGLTYLQIRQEHLTRNPDVGRDLELMSMTYAYYADSDPDPFEIYSKMSSSLIRDMEPDRFFKLCETVKTIVDIGKKNGFDEDIHRENTMMRGNTPVIIDPWIVMSAN